MIYRNLVRNLFKPKKKSFGLCSFQRNNVTKSVLDVKSNANIDEIVDKISKLSLIESTILIQSLKTKLNIPDTVFHQEPHPLNQTKNADSTTEESEPVAEKKNFDVELKSFDAANKPKIIKEIKSLFGWSLVESKKFVEAAPKILKQNLGKEEADELKKILEALGCKINLI